MKRSFVRFFAGALIAMAAIFVQNFNVYSQADGDDGPCNPGHSSTGHQHWKGAGMSDICCDQTTPLFGVFRRITSNLTMCRPEIGLHNK